MNDAVQPTGRPATGFRNQQLDPSQLPDHTAVSFAPVIRGYLTYALVLWGGLIGVPIVVIAAVGGTLAFGGTIGLAAGGAALLLAAALTVYGYLDARVFGWAVREQDLVTRQGIIWRKVVVVPLVRIQHVELASGPLERAFGAAQLQAFTAGSGGADLVIHGLAAERAEQLREYLRTHIDVDGPETTQVTEEVVGG